MGKRRAADIYAVLSRRIELRYLRTVILFWGGVQIKGGSRAEKGIDLPSLFPSVGCGRGVLLVLLSTNWRSICVAVL